MSPTETNSHAMAPIGSTPQMIKRTANQRKRFSHAMTKKPQPQPRLKSLDEARAMFQDTGVSKAAWARAHKVSRAVVYQVLAGKKKGVRGQSHKIAVLLGIKRGRLGVRADELASPEMSEVAA